MCEVGPVEFVVDLFFSELHFSTVVGEDSAWGAVATGKMLLIPVDPPLFGLLHIRGVVPRSCILGEEKCHAKHVAAGGRVAKLTTGLTRAIITLVL